MPGNLVQAAGGWFSGPGGTAGFQAKGPDYDIWKNSVKHQDGTPSPIVQSTAKTTSKVFSWSQGSVVCMEKGESPKETI